MLQSTFLALIFWQGEAYCCQFFGKFHCFSSVFRDIFLLKEINLLYKVYDIFISNFEWGLFLKTTVNALKRNLVTNNLGALYWIVLLLLIEMSCCFMVCIKRHKYLQICICVHGMQCLLHQASTWILKWNLSQTISIRDIWWQLNHFVPDSEKIFSDDKHHCFYFVIIGILIDKQAFC